MQRHEALDTGHPPAVRYSGRGSVRYAACSPLHAAVQTDTAVPGVTSHCQKGDLQPDETCACHTAQGSLPGRSSRCWQIWTCLRANSLGLMLLRVLTGTCCISEQRLSDLKQVGAQSRQHRLTASLHHSAAGCCHPAHPEVDAAPGGGGARLAPGRPALQHVPSSEGI